MRRILLLLCGIMFIPVLCYPQHLVEVGKGYSCTSVNTTVFRNNSLITHGDEQYISYYDAEGYLVLGKRKLNSELWTLHRTQYRGNVKDAHNIIRRQCYLSGILLFVRWRFIVCLPFRFFRTW